MSSLGVDRWREGSQVLMALHFKTGGDLNEECCTAVFHTAQSKLNSSVKGEAGACFQQKCLFILEWKPIRKRQQNRSVRQKQSQDAADPAELCQHGVRRLSPHALEMQDEGCGTPLCSRPASFKTEKNKDEKQAARTTSWNHHEAGDVGSFCISSFCSVLVLLLCITQNTQKTQNKLKKWMVKCRIIWIIFGFSSDATKYKVGWLPLFCSVDEEPALVYVISYLTPEVNRGIFCSKLLQPCLRLLYTQIQRQC